MIHYNYKRKVTDIKLESFYMAGLGIIFMLWLISKVNCETMEFKRRPLGKAEAPVDNLTPVGRRIGKFGE
jgi:hypothetical protein